MDEMEVRKITRTSVISGTTRTFEIAATAEQWQAWENGALIQNAFPHLSKADREFIMTGITGAEWDGEFDNDRMTWGDE